MNIMGFVTVSGSRYLIDWKNKEISGGFFKTPKKFKKVSIMQGSPAVITLMNGQQVKTSEVYEYISLRNI